MPSDLWDVGSGRSKPASQLARRRQELLELTGVMSLGVEMEALSYDARARATKAKAS